jgi:2,4-dienoyl-CoA reductase-like NADH-dependent reductase (Old Yellow Enzyme family)
MLAHDSKPSVLQPSMLQPSMLLQRPGRIGPLRLKNRVVMGRWDKLRHHRRYGGPVGNRMRLLMETVRLIRSELPDFPMMVRLSATEYADGGYSLDDIVTLSNGKRSGRHHDRIRLRALCHPLCHP